MRHIFVLLVTLPVIACSTPTAWQRPDATIVDADRDQRECSRLAARQLQSESWWEDDHTAAGSLDAQRRSSVFDQQQKQLDFKMEQQNLAAACMQARGYQQEPVSPRN